MTCSGEGAGAQRESERSGEWRGWQGEQVMGRKRAMVLRFGDCWLCSLIMACGRWNNGYLKMSTP